MVTIYEQNKVPDPNAGASDNPAFKSGLSGDAQVIDNQARAKALGVTIPGVGGGNPLGITSSSDVSKDQQKKKAIDSAGDSMTGSTPSTPATPVPMTAYEQAQVDLRKQELDQNKTNTDNAQKNYDAENAAITLSYNANLATNNNQYNNLRQTLQNQYETDMKYAVESTTQANPYGAAVGGDQSLKNYQKTITDKYNAQAADIEAKASAAASQLQAGEFEAFTKTQKELDDANASFAKDMFTFKSNMLSEINKTQEFQAGEKDKAQTAYRLSLTQLPQDKRLTDLPDNISDLTPEQQSLLKNQTAYQQGIAAGFTPQSLLTDIKTSVASSFKQQKIDQDNTKLAIDATKAQIQANTATLDNALKTGKLLDMQIQQGQSAGFQNHPLGNDFYQAIQSLNPKSNDQIFTNISGLLTAGNTDGAKTALTNYIFANEPASTKSIINGLQDVAGYAQTLKDKIAALPKDQQTGLLAGNFQALSEKFGQSGNSQLAEIGREFGHLALIYKSEVFGKRAVVSNDSTLSTLYPSIKDTSDLNFATFDAMTNTANEVLNGKVKAVLPAAQYQAIYGDNGVLSKATPSKTDAGTWQGLQVGSVMTNKNDGKLYTITATGPVLK